MVTVALWIAVMRIVMRDRFVPYVKRYGYNRRMNTRFAGLREYDEAVFVGAHHRARNVRRNLRHTVGNYQVVKAARSVGYAARMSWMGKHEGGVYA